MSLRALRANRLTVAKSAFGRLKDSKFLHLIEAIERDQAERGGGAGAGASASAAKPVPSQVVGKTEGSSSTRRGRASAAATSTAPQSNQTAVPVSKITLDPSWQAEMLAYQGHHHEAAKIYARAGRVDEAIRLFTDLRRWNDAKMFAQSLSAEGHASSFDHSHLVKQQAEWLEEINDWKGAATIFISMEKYMQAAKLLAESASPDNIGWQVQMSPLRV